jgi:protein-S-isoprenylcysteine O-methyltransferase Ste14
MNKAKFSISQQAILGLVFLAAVVWLALFIPAGKLTYWQGWLYWIVFFTNVTTISIYFIKKDPNLISSRVKVGPTAEKKSSQKISQAFAAIFFVLLLLIPPFDFRFGWSNVPLYLVLISDVFVAIGFFAVFLVFRQNTFASAIIEVKAEQKVISTGVYGVVRHPMYSGALMLLFFTPLALGSFWGLLAFFPMIAIICFRLIDEEKTLSINLKGYAEYCKKTRYRLIPYVW